jgi:hypothetical protein
LGQELFRYTRAVGKPLPHHLKRHNLYRLIRTSAMPIGTLVLLAKRLCERGNSLPIKRARRDGDGQFKGLPLVMQVRRASNAHLAGQKAIGSKLHDRVCSQMLPGRIEFLQICLAQQAAEGPRIMVLNLGV